MAKRTGAKAEARIPLSRERVLSAAIALADESGIESLSMRKLAERLGVEAMSLYNHIANKNDLLGRHRRGCGRRDRHPCRRRRLEEGDSRGRDLSP
jgi:Bacterial regulatory proteins, tetR family.